MRPVVKSGGGKRTAFLIVLLLLASLGAGGYFGWKWWQDRQAAQTQVAQAQQPVTPPPAPVKSDTTATIVEAPTATTDIAATTTTTTATATEPTTTTIARSPMNVTATAPPATATTASAPPPATTTATTTVQPLPVVTPKTMPAGDTRLEQMARDFAANPQGNFTVQVQILCTPSNVEQAMRQGGGQIWFVPQSIKGRSCYRVLYGHYQTREEATVGLSRVPAALRDPNMAVKPIPR
jgi:septal ring-binding cell division protein DamX